MKLHISFQHNAPDHRVNERLLDYLGRGQTWRFHALMRACALTNQTALICALGKDPPMYQLPTDPHMYQLPTDPHMYQLPTDPHMYQLPTDPHMYQLPTDTRLTSLSGPPQVTTTQGEETAWERQESNGGGELSEPGCSSRKRRRYSQERPTSTQSDLMNGKNMNTSYRLQAITSFCFKTH